MTANYNVLTRCQGQLRHNKQLKDDPKFITFSGPLFIQIFDSATCVYPDYSCTELIIQQHQRWVVTVRQYHKMKILQQHYRSDTKTNNVKLDQSRQVHDGFE